jgi:hypothetical protein
VRALEFERREAALDRVGERVDRRVGVVGQRRRVAEAGEVATARG